MGGLYLEIARRKRGAKASVTRHQLKKRGAHSGTISTIRRRLAILRIHVEECITLNLFNQLASRASLAARLESIVSFASWKGRRRGLRIERVRVHSYKNIWTHARLFFVARTQSSYTRTHARTHAHTHTHTLTLTHTHTHTHSHSHSHSHTLTRAHTRVTWFNVFAMAFGTATAHIGWRRSPSTPPRMPEFWMA